MCVFGVCLYMFAEFHLAVLIIIWQNDGKLCNFKCNILTILLLLLPFNRHFSRWIWVCWFPLRFSTTCSEENLWGLVEWGFYGPDVLLPRISVTALKGTEHWTQPVAWPHPLSTTGLVTEWVLIIIAIHSFLYCHKVVISEPVAEQVTLCQSILLLIPHGCRWRKWAPYLRLAGRSRHMLRCQVGVAVWAWSLLGKQTWIGNYK